MKKLKGIIFSISSDIGTALAKEWKEKGYQIVGTYRSEQSLCNELKDDKNIQLIRCDLSNTESVLDACNKIINICPSWDFLVLAAGSMEPIGNFEELDFDDWQQGIQVNFISQLRVVHSLLPYRSSTFMPTVLFFAGGGVNGAVEQYSSYTLSKISLIKACELLDEEIPDTCFVIVGPGWVKTKIHNLTLNAGKNMARGNYQKTVDMLKDGEFVSMQKVVDCCTWLITSQNKNISGRNYSVKNDSWGTDALESALQENDNMYKLRRNGNDWESGVAHKELPTFREL